MTFAGLDIGTTTICGLLLDRETGRIVEVISEPNSAGMKGKSPWEALQDPAVILAQASRIVRDLIGRRRDVRALGVTGQMHGILYIDAQGQAASPLVTWQDGRGDQLDTDGKSCAERVSKAAGSRASTGMGTVTHLFDVRAGDVPRTAVGLCTIGDYVAMRLAGAATPIMDPTNAASIACFDLRSLRFDREALVSLGLDPSFYPRLDSSYPALGEIGPGIPVFTAFGDNQASYLGSVAEVSGSILVNVGTGSQISVPLRDDAEIPGVDIRPFPFGGYLAVGAGLCGGSAYALLRTFFSRAVSLFTSEAKEIDWGIMNAIDSSTLPGEPLGCDTRFSGTRENPALRGSITNLGISNFTPEHLITAVREGIVSELLSFYARLPAEVRAASRRLVGSGNGIRFNPALRRLFEERLGMSMSIPAHREGACFGAALLAGIACGALSGLAAAGRLIRASDDSQ